MTTVLQFTKNVQKLDILLNKLQTAFPILVTNTIRKGSVIYIECSSKPTIEDTNGISQIINEFDDAVFDGIELEKPMNLLSTTKNFVNIECWTLVCKWQYQGSYVHVLKKIIAFVSIVSNDPKGYLSLRMFDVNNNKVIALLQEGNSSMLQQMEMTVGEETLPYLPTTLEIHVKSTSDKDIVTFQNITAFYNV